MLCALAARTSDPVRLRVVAGLSSPERHPPSRLGFGLSASRSRRPNATGVLVFALSLIAAVAHSLRLRGQGSVCHERAHAAGAASKAWAPPIRGTEHFISQRVTAVALVPLAIWFVISALVADRRRPQRCRRVSGRARERHPDGALHHRRPHAHGARSADGDRGLLHSEGGKIALLVLNKFFAWVVGAASIFALLKIALSHSLS